LPSNSEPIPARLHAYCCCALSTWNSGNLNQESGRGTYVALSEGGRKQCRCRGYSTVSVYLKCSTSRSRATSGLIGVGYLDCIAACLRRNKVGRCDLRPRLHGLRCLKGPNRLTASDDLECGLPRETCAGYYELTYKIGRTWRSCTAIRSLDACHGRGRQSNGERTEVAWHRVRCLHTYLPVSGRELRAPSQDKRRTRSRLERDLKLGG